MIIYYNLRLLYLTTILALESLQMLIILAQMSLWYISIHFTFLGEYLTIPLVMTIFRLKLVLIMERTLILPLSSINAQAFLWPSLIKRFL